MEQIVIPHTESAGDYDEPCTIAEAKRDKISYRGLTPAECGENYVNLIKAVLVDKNLSRATHYARKITGEPKKK